MSLDASKREQLLPLLDALCAGSADREVIQQLEALIEGDPAAQWFYLQHLDLYGTLVWNRSAEAERSALTDMKSRLKPRRPRPSQVDDSASLLMEAIEIDVKARARREAERAAELASRQAEETRSWSLLLHRGDELTPVRHIVIPRAVVYCLAAAMIALALMVILREERPSAAPSPHIDTAAPIAATVIDTVDLHLSGEGAAMNLTPGVRLPAGQSLTIESGLVKLAMGRGVSAIVQGPAQLELVDDARIRLSQGQLVTYCPPGAEGFAIDAPSAQLIDLGTEFGAWVHPHGAFEAHVFQGQVALKPGSGPSAQAITIDAGQANRVDRTGGNVQSAPSEPLAFVRNPEFEALVQARAGSTYHRWLAYSYELRRDPSLLTLMAITEDHSVTSRSAEHDDASGWDPRTLRPDRRGVRPTTTSGRFDQTRALHFKPDLKSHLMLPDDERLRIRGDMTVAWWMKASKLSNGRLTLFSHGYWVAGADNEREDINYHYSFGLNDGYVWALHEFDAGRDVEALSRMPIQPDRWIHVAIVRDSIQREYRFYIDGEPQGRSVYERGPSGGDSPQARAALGRAGNASNEYFDGLIDEFVLFDRAISDSEIRALYRAGDPYPDEPQGRNDADGTPPEFTGDEVDAASERSVMNCSLLNGG